jgi:anti-sigma-K factor RskA
MTAYTRDELLLIATAHATGAASSEEELALYAAMQNDPEVRRELTASVHALHAMAQAQAVAPSDLVRGRLLAQARAFAPVQLASATAGTRRPPVRNAVMMVAVAALCVVIVGLGAEVIRMRGQLAGATAFAGSLRAELAKRDAMLNPMLGAENHLRVVHMLTRDTVQGPGIQVYWNRVRGTAVLHAFRLPMAPAGYRYQLWALGDAAPRPLLAFDSETNGHTLISRLEIPVELAGVSSLAVTVEPVAGSVAPTSAPIVWAAVAR